MFWFWMMIVIAENDTIEKGIKIISSDINIGVVACKIVNPISGLIETKSLPYYPLTFVGCGAILKEILL